MHRDLKPSNLFLTQRSDGSPLVKVLDFGISKTTGGEFEPLTGNLTETRSVLGTPFYMSPEQVRDAKKVDARTDIWSLGLILHELLLSASPAFEGTTLPGVCAAIAADPPAALRLKRPEVPLEVEAIVLKCLEKDPNRRFQTARDLFDKLTPWTGRVESVHSSPLSDATIRSSPLSFELAEAARRLDGVVVPPASSGGGTLASAVFTQSGERVVARPVGVSRLASTESAPAPPAPGPTSTRSASMATAESGLGKRSTLALGAAALLGLASIIAWALATGGRPEQVAAPASAPSLPLGVPQRAALPVFSAAHRVGPRGGAGVRGRGVARHDAATAQRRPGERPALPRKFSVRRAGYEPYTIVQGAAEHDTRVLAELTRESVAAAPVEATPAEPPKLSASHAPPPARPVKPPRPPPPATSTKLGSDIFMQR